MRATLLITLLLAAATIKSETRMPATPLMEHSANYEANITKGLKLNGKATRSLSQRDDGTWLYNFNVDTLPATISENSVFKVGTKGIVPISYEYKLAGMLIKDRNQSVNFDQNNDKIIDPKGAIWADIKLKNGKTRKHEFYYGSSYLSQSSRKMIVLDYYNEVVLHQQNNEIKTMACPTEHGARQRGASK